MKQVAIGNINNVAHTVLFYDIGVAPSWAKVYANWDYQDNKYDVCILPPLPKHPTKDDADIFSLYKAHGIYITLIVHGTDDAFPYNSSGVLMVDEGWGEVLANPEIHTFNYATNKQGELVEVAIV